MFPGFCRAVPPLLDPRLQEDLRKNEACRLPFTFGTPRQIHPVETDILEPASWLAGGRIWIICGRSSELDL